MKISPVLFGLSREFFVVMLLYVAHTAGVFIAYFHVHFHDRFFCTVKGVKLARYDDRYFFKSLLLWRGKTEKMGEMVLLK